MEARTCSMVGCEKAVHGRGLCMTHYQAERRRGGFAGRVYDSSRRRFRTGCDVPGCKRPHRARGLCATHYVAALRDGTRDDHPLVVE